MIRIVGKMENIKVSIIVPIYNVEKYLKECLESLVNQTLQEVEIILVIDGSTDGSETIACEYTERYDNIKMIVQENQGLSGARNTGMKLAKGKYIYFVDSDDYISLNAMELLYTTAEKQNIDVVLFDADVFLDGIDKFDYTHMENIDYYDRPADYAEVVSGQEMFYRMYHNSDYRASACLLFINKNILVKKEIEFYRGIIHEDELFTFQLLFESSRVIHINQKLFHRRLRKDSIMTNSKTRKHFEGCYCVIQNIMLKYSMEKMNLKMQGIFQRFITDNVVIAFNWYVDMKAADRKQLKDYLDELGRYAQMAEYTKKLYALIKISPRFYKMVRSVKRFVYDRRKKEFYTK